MNDIKVKVVRNQMSGANLPVCHSIFPQLQPNSMKKKTKVHRLLFGSELKNLNKGGNLIIHIYFIFLHHFKDIINWPLIVNMHPKQ